LVSSMSQNGRTGDTYAGLSNIKVLREAARRAGSLRPCATRSSRRRLRACGGQPVANIFQHLDLPLVVPEFLPWEPLQHLVVDAEILFVLMRKSCKVSVEDILTAGIVLPVSRRPETDSPLSLTSLLRLHFGHF